MPVRMNRVLVIAFGALLVLGLIAQGAGTFSPAAEADSAAATPAPAVGKPARRDAGFASDVLEIKRDASGQFRFSAAVNGQDTGFLIDTGADLVALTVDDAERLGFDINRDDFVPIGQTASGTGYGQPLTIDSIDVGGTELTDVEAVVIDGLHENLLGQSVLRQLEKVEMNGDVMRIHRS